MKIPLLELFKNADGWIIRNLRAYGNSLIPNNLIKDYEISDLEKILTMIMEKTVKIRKGEDPTIFIADVVK